MRVYDVLHDLQRHRDAVSIQAQSNWKFKEQLTSVSILRRGLVMMVDGLQQMPPIVLFAGVAGSGKRRWVKEG